MTIADYAGQSVQLGLAYYLGFLALVSVSLGVLNLLPLPMLDGGHLMYYLFEGVTGRPVSDAVARQAAARRGCHHAADDVRSRSTTTWPACWACNDRRPHCVHRASTATSPTVCVPAACPVCRSLVAVALHVGSACAVEPFVLKDIRVEGLQRTDAGTVFAALPFRDRRHLHRREGRGGVARAVRHRPVQGRAHRHRGDVAVVIVEERAVIASVDFVGLKEFDKDALTKSLRDSASAKACRSTGRCSTAPSRRSSASTCRAACTAPRS